MKRVVVFLGVLAIFLLRPGAAYALPCPIYFDPSYPSGEDDPDLVDGKVNITAPIADSPYAGGNEYFFEMCKEPLCNNPLGWPKIINTNYSDNTTSYDGSLLTARISVTSGTHRFRIVRDGQVVCTPVTYIIPGDGGGDPGSCPDPNISSPRTINSDITFSVDATNVNVGSTLYVSEGSTLFGVIRSDSIDPNSGINELTIPGSRFSIDKQYEVFLEDGDWGRRLCSTTFGVTTTEDETSTFEPFEATCDYPGTSGDEDGIDSALGCIPTEPEAFIGLALPWAIGIGGGIGFLLGLYGVAMIILSAGNPEKMQAGRELITSVIAGIAVIIFAIFLLRFIGVDILGLFPE